MKRAVFEIKQNAVGRYYFIFKDDKNENPVYSGSFGERSELEKSIVSVREASSVAAVCENDCCIKPPVFKISEVKDGFDFTFIDFNGRIIFTSNPYSEKSFCINAIKKLKCLAFDAKLIDLV